MDDLVIKMDWAERDPSHYEPLLTREWLVTNGLGGYSSGTVAGVVTRRYHGLLVAALANPLGRQVMLASLGERVMLPDGTEIALGGEESTADDLAVPGAQCLKSFSMEAGLPVWRYQVGDAVLVKRVLMPHLQ